ncbi:bis(5'-nucleosyl)-tetraphosphatase [asymmetrical] [Homalodisca vitripennis]|uniref:bis(5'-nucleosyl)-tetraphosphatase [asymmetrical] n=1 Tax=Homalodisca vitripennis TaxID=197043 RepID=UPI001EEA8ED1|nr:bis(5'-nucleosyl)-tetraphosphatase [asymmetrical] [Homalodisca vitripennis]
MPVRAAGFIIFRRLKNIEFLLMQTSYGINHWTPPKGHVDGDETDYEAALRETKEEAGFDEEDLKIYTDFKKELKYNVNGKPKVVTYWLAELVRNDTPVELSSEHQDFKWLELTEACQLAGYQDMSNLLAESHKFITAM